MELFFQYLIQVAILLRNVCRLASSAPFFFMADPTPNPNPVPAPEPDDKATSADIVTGKWSKVVKALETRVSVLEDSNSKLSETNKSYEARFAVLAQTPSKQPGKSLLQELDEFVFGPKPQA